MDMAVGKSRHMSEENNADADILSKVAEEDLQNDDGAS
jgi:hypothetical protein